MPSTTDASAEPNVPLVTISALHYEWETVEEAFDRCQSDLHLGGIEFSLVAGGQRPHLLESEYDQVADLAAGSPLELSGHIWEDLPQLGAMEAVERLRYWLSVAQHLRFRYIIVHGGAHDDPSLGVSLMTEVFGSVADDYHAAGVTLCLENHYAWDYRDCHELLGSSDELQELFDAIESPGLAFCLDYGHSHMTGNTQKLLRRVGHRLAYVHLADNMGEHDDHVAFGRGTVPWREVLTLTRDIGYRGPFTVEFPVRGDDRAPLRECLELIREVWE